MAKSPENARSALHDAVPEIPRSETDPTIDPAERFEIRRLCECSFCAGIGKIMNQDGWPRCPECRGEGRTLELVATCGSAEALGVALVTLAREGEFEDCPLGLLDRLGEPGLKWLVKPWGPSPRNVSDAGRVLRGAQK